MTVVTSEKEATKRLTYVDIAKGIGIFLVVGHCIPDATSSTGISIGFYRWLHDVIYSFHMPLFFFLSGFMVSRKKMVNSGYKPIDILYKRGLRLLIPYIFVGLCYAPFKMLLSKFANKPYDISTIWQIFIGINPDGELWFLYSLFIVTVIAALFSFRVSVLGLVVSILLLIWNPWGIVTKYIFFFLLGIYIRYNMTYGDFIQGLTYKHIIVVGLFLLIGLYGLIIMKWNPCFLITATSGIVLTLWFSFQLSHLHSFISNVLEQWGILSMDIYVLSDIIKIPFRIIFWNKLHFYTFSFVICIIFSMLLSILISKYIIQKNKILKFLVFGIKTNR